MNMSSLQASVFLSRKESEIFKEKNEDVFITGR